MSATYVPPLFDAGAVMKSTVIWLAVLFVLTAGVIASTLYRPVESWRNGHRPAEGLVDRQNDPQFQRELAAEEAEIERLAAEDAAATQSVVSE